jgi:hypothetical protein
MIHNQEKFPILICWVLDLQVPVRETNDAFSNPSRPT